MQSKIKVIFTLIACYFLFFVLHLKQQPFFISNLFYLSLKVFLYLAYFILLFIMPGFLLVSLPKFKCNNILDRLLLSFPVSMFLYIAGFTIYKVFRWPINSHSFMFFLITAITVLVLSNKGNAAFSNFRPKELNLYKLFWGIALIATVFFLFREKFCLEVFSGDGSEHLERALSLRHFFLPHQESPITPKLWIPSIYTPSILYSFFDFFCLIFFGVSEAVFRLPYQIFLLSLYYILCGIIDFGGVKLTPLGRGLLYPAIALFLLLYTIIVFFYTSSSGYFVDIMDANEDLMLAFFTLAQIYFLQKRRPVAVLIFAISAILLLYFGLIYTILILAAFFILHRDQRKMIKWIAKKYVILILLGFAGFIVYGYFRGCLNDLLFDFRYEFIENKFCRENSLNEILIYFKHFLVFIGIVPFLSFLIISKEKLLRGLIAITTVYFILLMSSGYKNLHYFSFIAVIPALVFIMQTDFPFRLLRNANFRLIIFLAFLLASFVLVIPKKNYFYNHARKFGEQTSILLKDYRQTYSPEAYEQARAVTSIFRTLKLAGPYVTWEKYAKTEITDETHFVFTDQPKGLVNQGFRLVERDDSVYFFAKNNYLAELKSKKVLLASDFLNSFFDDLWEHQFYLTALN